MAEICKKSGSDTLFYFYTNGLFLKNDSCRSMLSLAANNKNKKHPIMKAMGK